MPIIKSWFLDIYRHCFLAYNSADDDNVTGDGTTFTVEFDTEVFDVGSNFISNTFTAPVTGKYQLSGMVSLEQIDAGHDIVVRIITSNRQYIFNHEGATAHAELSIPFSTLADMDKGDTAYVQVTVSGGTKTVDVSGTDASETFFCGFLAA